MINIIKSFTRHFTTALIATQLQSWEKQVVKAVQSQPEQLPRLYCMGKLMQSRSNSTISAYIEEVLKELRLGGITERSVEPWSAFIGGMGKQAWEAMQRKARAEMNAMQMQSERLANMGF